MPPDKVWPSAPAAPPPTASRRQKHPVFIAGFVMSLLSFLLIGKLDSLFVGARLGAMADCTLMVALPMTVATAWCLADVWRGLRCRSKVSVILAVAGLLLNLNAFWAVFVRLK